ncbi:MAG: MBL fold metallo-hydrolase [Prolixibacteraceae bacterium]|nr:MBL fold metallo-hydrolase [Prolixibacteraceae bacterium]
MKKVFIGSMLILFSWALHAQEEGQALPSWQEGEMEIHHIYTGRGEAVFCILPDGTTLLIDAGDSGPHRDPRTTKASPDDSRQPGEWIARYITKRMDFKPEKKIDYAFLTHFHGDHMGGVFRNSPKTTKGGNYYLSGLTEVYEHISFSKMVDRDWPGYQYPKPQTGRGFENYRSFIDWNTKNSGMKMERFVAGSNSQFVLVNHPEKYKGIFEVRNIVSSGEVWTGEEDQTNKFFPEVFPQGQSIDENKCSAGIRISYGDFDYFNGGDLSGRLPLGSESWRDIETPVGKALGPVEVCEANHHAWIDAMSENFLSNVKPQIIVLQVWHVTHLNLSVMQSMANKKLNPNLKHIIPTQVPELSRAYLGDDQLQKITGNGGHAVIKVAPEGKQYSVILLATEDESFRVKSTYGPFPCIKTE